MGEKLTTSHSDFAATGGGSRIVAAVDFTGAANGGGDAFGHGTHVAGLVGGSGATGRALGVNYAGVAPDVKLVDLRVLDANGAGSIENLLGAFEWVLANRAKYGIRIVNLSAGTPPRESYRLDPICRAVDQLVSAGVAVVVAAGNAGKDAAGATVYGGILSPANTPRAIAVGAANTFQTDVRNDDTVTSFSSRGPVRSFSAFDTNSDGTAERFYDDLLKPDLLAPGNRLVSTTTSSTALWLDHPELRAGDGYLTLSGTSMAAPVVSGIAALLLQARPDLTPALLKAVLMNTAQPIAGTVSEQGAGLVNAAAAEVLTASLVANPGTLAYGASASPLAIATPSALSTTIAGQTVPVAGNVQYVDGWYFGDRLYRARGLSWGSGQPGSTTAAWGSGTLYRSVLPLCAPAPTTGTGLLWADGVLWAEATEAPPELAERSFSPIWRTGLLWGDGILWADGVLWSEGLLWADDQLHGDGLLWADGRLVGDGILWSDGLLWGDGLLWADGLLWGD